LRRYTLAAVLTLLDCRAVTDFLPPLTMLATGKTPAGNPKVSLAAFFRQVDTDMSGALDAGELKRALRAIGLGAEQAEGSMATLDTDGDGKVTLLEFEAGLGPAARRALEAQLNAEGRLDSFRPLVDVARVFQQLDQDGSGTLSAAELGAALHALGVVGVDLAECMAGFDEDADGEVSLQEWRDNLTPRTKALMAKRLDHRGLIAGVPPRLEGEGEAEAAGAGVPAAEPPAPVAAAAAAEAGDPLDPLGSLSAGEKGALWDAIRLAVDLDPASPTFFPTRLAAVAAGPAIHLTRVQAAAELLKVRQCRLTLSNPC